MDKYISREDYLERKGIDLEIELQDDDNHSHKIRRFVHEVTDWCINQLLLGYCANELLNFQALPEWRQERFRNGVMEQMEYILNNGWINKDSGIVREVGQIMNLGFVKMAPNAFDEFKLGAFCNPRSY